MSIFGHMQLNESSIAKLSTLLLRNGCLMSTAAWVVPRDEPAGRSGSCGSGPGRYRQHDRIPTEGVSMRIRTIAAIAAIPATAAAALLASTGAASAATIKPPQPVIASTYEAGLPDTTTVPTGTDSPQGPVWAYDDMTRVLTATQTAPGTWTVT